MTLSRLLFRRDARATLAIVALGVLSGLASAGLIAVVNRALHDPNGRTTLFAVFAAVVLLKIASNAVASLWLVRLSQACLERLLDDMVRRLLQTPLRHVEEIGTPRLMAALTDDTASVSSAILAIPKLMLNIAVLVGCAAYLAYLSREAVAVMLVFASLGAFVYRVLLRKARQALKVALDGRDRLFAHLRALTDGFKELKLNCRRRETFLDKDFREALDCVRRHTIVAKDRYVAAEVWSQVIFYLLMATMLFGVAGGRGISSEALSGYVFTALYAAGPIFAIVAVIPVLHRGRAALDRIEMLCLSAATPCHRSLPPFADDRPPVLQFSAVQFTYLDGGNTSGFGLGPIDLTMQPGELIFVVGGNGSGKTTFMKLLTGLYLPTAGEIRVDGRVLRPESYQTYRELFSAVYSDFFLFHRLPPVGCDGLELRGAELLEKLGLSGKVRIVDQCLSNTALSQGQRRRLALLSAYLEDRPIYVLDEWAADQDPSYRQTFYTDLLPELTARGKTVIVVTHDDRYFHLGDKILELDYGRMVQVRTRAHFAGRVATASEDTVSSPACE